MPNKSRKQALREFLAAGRITAIGAAEWQAALRTLAPISESYLRDLLRETGLAFAQPYAGIRQKSFADLEHDLREMLAIYAEAMRAGDRQRARRAARAVTRMRSCAVSNCCPAAGRSVSQWQITARASRSDT